MTVDILPATDTPFGQRVRHQLNNEHIVWLTTVGRDGAPQPNPVWFVWAGGHEIIVYTLPSAHRLTHIAERPQVSLNFNSPDGHEVVVLRGRAEQVDDLPPPSGVPEYLAKYGEAMAQVSGSLDAFDQAFPIALRIRITRVRGY